MSITFYKKTALTGGGASALDGIDGTGLLDGDVAFVMVGNVLYTYQLDDDSGAAESSPNIIAPDVNAGNKRWILQRAVPVFASAAEITTGTETAKAIASDQLKLSSPTVVTVKCTNLTDGYIPKHTSDAVGLADTTITTTANGEVTNAYQPAFLAYKSGATVDVTGDGTAYTVVCNTEIFDQGNHHNNSTGIFTAPVTGRYCFAAMTYVYGMGAAHNDQTIRVVTSNRTYSNEQSFASSANPFVSRSFQISLPYVDMDAGDTAYFQVMISGGTKIVDIYGEAGVYTFFSGGLVC